MPSRSELLAESLQVLREEEPLTLDVLARRTRITRPGVIYHFPSKEALMRAVVDTVIDRWEDGMLALTRGEGDDRLRAYVTYACTAELDASDLAILADARLRDELRDQWETRMRPWVHTPPSHPYPQQRIAARLIADGAWFNGSLGIPTMAPTDREALLELALRLLDTKETD